MKESALRDCMQRIAKIDVHLSEALSIGSNDWGYRHRGRFKVSGQTIGFSQEKSNNLITIERCPLMTTDINNALSVLRQVVADNPQIFRNIDEICLVNNSASKIWQENVVVSFLGKPNADNISKLRSALSEYNLKQVVFPGCEAGKSNLRNQIPEHDNDFELQLIGVPYATPHELRYKVSPTGFFQANWNLNLKMIEKVIDSLKPLENKVVLDIFSGAGNFSLPVALAAKSVIAVEANPTAVSYGKLNAKLNNIGNIEFHNISSQQLSKKHFRNIDAVILDPPRSGIGNHIAKLLLNNPVDTVIYVSCDPSTLARDLGLLSEKYVVNSLRLVDMFPQTYHVESLAILRLMN
jgi:23S rRNA (uracil1939-C5)-methyltransferase